MAFSQLRHDLEGFLKSTTSPLLAIVGPTASGKTALSLQIAQELNGEIVNADSRQIYRFLDIGTAKLPVQERRGIPHHLLDLLDPKQQATVGWYQEEARGVIEDVHRHHQVPILVGGSMLYVSSIIDGLSFAPSAPAEIRRRLEAEYDTDGGKSLYRRLQGIDPEAASTMHPNNRVYIVRAMEIVELTKQPKSLAVKRHGCPEDCFIIGTVIPRQEWERRIEDRVEGMFERGWIDEVRSLLERGYEPSDPGMRSTGYREIGQFLKESEEAEDSEEMLEKLKHRIVVKTRQYAKRQLAWWRNDQRIHWLNTREPLINCP